MWPPPSQSNGGGASATLRTTAVRKLAGAIELPRRVRAECVDDRANGWHVRVVEQHSSADLHARRDVPPVERGVREAVRAVDEHEVERALLELRQHLVREPDPERDPRRVDPAGGRLRAEPLLLVGCGRDRLVVRARRCEDERRGARPGLERRHPGPDLALQPLERLPREPPVLRAAGVQAGRIAAKLVGQGPHAPIIAAE